jgi:hypothetical protein
MAQKAKNKTEKKKTCMICGKPSAEPICDSCKIKVQAEALEKKQEVEKEGRIDTGRR